MQPPGPASETLPERYRQAVEAVQRGERLRSPLPRQRPTLAYYPGLPTRCFFDTQEFPWALALEQNSAAILQEFRAVQQAQDQFAHIKASVKEGRWTAYYLWAEGKRNEDHCARCPLTTRLLEAAPIQRDCGLCYIYFSVLDAGTHILPHFGPTNIRLRCHLGLQVPEGCTLRVAEETRAWQEGRCLIFDDSFDHEVRHSGQGQRVVLLIDFWHPDLSPAEIQGLCKLLPPA